MVDKLTHQQVIDYKEVFRIFDKDGNGIITAPELKEIMKKQGKDPTNEEVRALLGFVDKDGSGTVDFEEFLSMVSRRPEENQTEGELREAFRLLDKNEDGFISKEELMSSMDSMDLDMEKDEIERLIFEFDFDQDGMLCYEEFVFAMLGRQK